MLILGHRGYSAKFPPNTVVAFVKAIEHGADGIELDVWRTKDGKVIVNHDRNLDKITGKNVDIKKNTSEYLRQYRIDGEPLPLLEEVYDSLPGNAYINVEIKDRDAVKPSLEIVNGHNALERTLFSSFDLKSLKKLRQLSKKAHVGILIDKKSKIISLIYWVIALRAEFINLPYQLRDILGLKFSRIMIKFYRLFRVKIVFWTVNSPENIKGLADLCDIIITDEVEKMLSFRGE